MAKTVVKNRDINSFSIWADSLRYSGDRSRGHVSHGIIRELSLVLAGANPGAHIEEIMAHGAEETDAGVIYNDLDSIDYDSGEFEDVLEHSAEEKEESEMAEEKKPTEIKKTASENEKTVKDVVKSMTEEQRNVMYALIGAAMDSESEDVEPNKNNEEEPEMIMVYGNSVFQPGCDGSFIPYNYTTGKSQFALFRMAPQYISNRQWYWLRDVVSATHFAYVNAYGYANYGNAGNVTGVRPYFVISVA